MRAIQKFEVGIKAFIINDKDELLLVQEHTGVWEIPGGRIDVGEGSAPLADILTREIEEELGTDIAYAIGAPVAIWVRNNPERTPIFLVGFLCKKLGGEITLSGEHQAYRWVTKENWQELPCAPGYHEAFVQFWEAYRHIKS